MRDIARLAVGGDFYRAIKGLSVITHAGYVFDFVILNDESNNSAILVRLHKSRIERILHKFAHTTRGLPGIER